MKYLYGASVQGIQGFIFQTDKLREIVGASNLVEEICTTFFKECVGNNNFKSENLIIGAAGNIKYLFEDKAACEHLVYYFPKAVMQKATGIAISQAVVEVEGDFKYEHLEVLDIRLNTQRNKPANPLNLGLMITERARRTGNPAVAWNDEGTIDLAQKQKHKASNDAEQNLISKISEGVNLNRATFPFEISDISNGKNWIAVVHADGNNLGQILRKLSSNISGDIQKAFREFSVALDKSTREATKLAFEEVFVNVIKESTDKSKIPFRPVLLGGDDLTLIIRGDLALDFTRRYLEHFEKRTKANFASFVQTYNLGLLLQNGLTACAGIAYIKTNYPFHYGVALSESLCKQAKRVARGINSETSPSCLQFHKVHASFIEEYESIIEKELSAPNNVRFNYGPYFLNYTRNYHSIKDLQLLVRKINNKDAPKAGFRNWLTELRNNPESASQLLKRLKDINKQVNTFLPNNNIDEPFTIRQDQMRYTPIFDIISLSNI